jgi:hypothetical protein
MRLRIIFRSLMPSWRWFRRRRVARLHESVEREQRRIDALEAATSEAEIEALARRPRSRRRPAMLLVTAAVAIGTAAGATAFVTTRHSGATAARPNAAEVVANTPRKERPPTCPFFNPPWPDLPVENHRPFRFEDGGGISTGFFSMVHPPGFSHGPLYQQHYELFNRKAPHVRIRVGFHADAEAGNPHFFLALAKQSLRETRGFEDLGTRHEVVGCLPFIRWDYERVVNGERLRAERYFFVSSTNVYHHTKYDLLFEAPAKDWRHWGPIFAYVKKSFRVDWHLAGAAPPKPR